MAVYFNPAGGLVANRIPCATGDGRFVDSAIGQHLGETVFIDRPANTKLMIRTAVGDILELQGSGTDAYVTSVQGSSRIIFRVNGTTPVGAFLSSGAFACGKVSDSSNGALQLASHSSLTGGLAFGTHATGAETIWRHASGVLRTEGFFRTPALVDSLGFKLVGLQRPYGWKLPTGAMSRATFDPATVTLSGLAERVAALIYDSHRDGAMAATGHGHGLLLDTNY